MVFCPPVYERFLDVVAKAIRPTPAEVPFGVGSLPGDDRISVVMAGDEQGQYVCVSAYSFDGPFPDRSAEIPALLEIAERLHLARDLDDRSTWFDAHRVLPQ